MKAADIGCGTVRWTRQLAHWGVQVTGYDHSREAIRQARQAAPDLRYEVWDVDRDIPRSLTPGSVDLITCRLAIAYPGRGRFMVDAARWLAPGVMFYAPTPPYRDRVPAGGFHRGLTEDEIEGLAVGWSSRITYRLGKRARAIVLSGYGRERHRRTETRPRYPHGRIEDHPPTITEGLS
ncbi:class I SAM-dependent methyltransferase [Streptomyces sp. 110]|uniref:Class I SAM-dependent methyltransferase n=1 Tax=Streptomyces endocoffeicus TaxID=2898945 RepID=A0ABS1PSL3_9ACTN|nr:class I SAM-dependent methyltransferase [Streptomyces endocoffeicus]MBL1115274.1 class I SAM-dependent methyltransferase [Streptomyces endocoffeicus]